MSNYFSQPFSPVYDENSRILILGSFPSVKSREQGFYYGHPQNRFWKVLAAICQVREPQSISEKKKMLTDNYLAVYDVIESCEIEGSSDSSIRNVMPADIRSIIAESNIEVVFTNGRVAGKLYKKYQAEDIGLPMIELPSTSPANAAFSLERLTEVWRGSMMAYLEK
ncbi:MAG: DNA-deoxyinosine glycosylase [Lachnospiraceae bacterium]|nr:DNA-deoxyinosine glycosylase [Lachnospiraceae bacterium]